MSTPFTNLQKQRKGLNRLLHALGYSWQGLRWALKEPAFRAEAWVLLLAVPGAFWLGNGWLEQSWLIGSWLWVMVVELLNTGVEAVVDRIGPEWHELSGKAKDVCSAAVTLAIAVSALSWGLALWHRLGA